MSKDYYRTLGLPSSASKEQVKAAFRRLALTWHPDRHAGCPEAHRLEVSNRFKAGAGVPAAATLQPARLPATACLCLPAAGNH